MDHKAWSSVWKTDCFLAASSPITETSGLEYILTRKYPLPLIAFHGWSGAFVMRRV
jgi:hypothetical protein